MAGTWACIQALRDGIVPAVLVGTWLPDEVAFVWVSVLAVAGTGETGVPGCGWVCRRPNPNSQSGSMHLSISVPVHAHRIPVAWCMSVRSCSMEWICIHYCYCITREGIGPTYS